MEFKIQKQISHKMFGVKKIQLRFDKDIVIIARCVNLCSTMAKGQG